MGYITVIEVSSYVECHNNGVPRTPHTIVAHIEIQKPRSTANDTVWFNDDASVAQFIATHSATLQEIYLGEGFNRFIQHIPEKMTEISLHDFSSVEELPARFTTVRADTLNFITTAFPHVTSLRVGSVYFEQLPLLSAFPNITKLHISGIYLSKTSRTDRLHLIRLLSETLRLYPSFRVGSVLLPHDDSFHSVYHQGKHLHKALSVSRDVYFYDNDEWSYVSSPDMESV